MALLEMGLVNKTCDELFRRCCCSWCPGRPTYPTDPWFEATMVDDYKVTMIAKGKELDVKFVEKTIREAGGRVKPWGPWVACTRDTICCGCVAAIDEARFGYLVVRSVTVEPTGRARLAVWPDHLDMARDAMADLKDNFGRKIHTQRIQRAQEEVAAEETRERAEADDFEDVPIATAVA